MPQKHTGRHSRHRASNLAGCYPYRGKEGCSSPCHGPGHFFQSLSHIWVLMLLTGQRKRLADLLGQPEVLAGGDLQRDMVLNEGTGCERVHLGHQVTSAPEDTEARPQPPHCQNSGRSSGPGSHGVGVPQEVSPGRSCRALPWASVHHFMSAAAAHKDEAPSQGQGHGFPLGTGGTCRALGGWERSAVQGTKQAWDAGAWLHQGPPADSRAAKQTHTPSHPGHVLANPCAQL